MTMWTRQLRGTFDQRGVTLIELVVTLALVAMISAGLVAIWSKSQEAYFIGSETAEVQQNVRAALDFMVREIRSTGKDVTNCAFDYATSGTFTAADCTAAKATACAGKLTGVTYGSCTNVFAVPFGTVGGVSVPSATAIAIRADRNDNGTVAGTTNSSVSDPGSENVLYRYWTAGNCPGGLPTACITRDDGALGSPQAMVSVDIAGFTLEYFPKPGFPPCNATPPQNPCPSFVPVDQADADGIGRIRITVTALQRTVGVDVSRTLVTDVILRNRNPNTGT